MLFDEVFVHRVVQLFASSTEQPNPENIAVYAGLIPQPDLVIYIKAPVDVCVQRIYDRGVWQRMQDRTPAELQQFIIHAAQAVTLMFEQLKTGGWNVIEVDNSGSELYLAQQELSVKLSQAGFLDNGVHLSNAVLQQVTVI